METVLTYRGRAVEPADVVFICALIAARPKAAAGSCRSSCAARGAGAIQRSAARCGPRRTLQRRLAAHRVSGTVCVPGGGKQRCYQLVANCLAEPRELAVSRAGQQVRSLVWRPMIHRPPVGYVAGFLESYRPNHDFYLDADLRVRLHHLGRVLGPERPAGTYARQILSRLLMDLS